MPGCGPYASGMPDAASLELRHSYAEALPGLSRRWRAEPSPEPAIAVLNEPLAEDLGLDPAWLRSAAGVRFLVGGEAAEGDGSGPAGRAFAQAYAGHQFGVYSPRLGDGRALLLGELQAPDGRIVDLHLKGSGATPFSRGADGAAALGPMLRELVVGEWMHAVGVPTTRALAVATTGERIPRDGRLVPGAILCRAAASHLRVGTFQYAAALGDRDQLRALADYAIARHHPAAAEAERPALALLDAVAAAQARLVARWMLLGFIHGVMNTDNITISGETIDYGPCAFMEATDPRAVFSSIDHGGRYAYGNQPAAALWNLARFGEALLPLIDEDEARAVELATAAVRGFEPAYLAAYRTGLAAKLGLPEPDDALMEDCLRLLVEHRIDWTSFFRELAGGDPAALFEDAGAYRSWAAARPEPDAAGRAAMRAANPPIVPRNRTLDAALDAATAGDLAPVRAILESVRDPWSASSRRAELLDPAPASSPPFVSYCGT